MKRNWKHWLGHHENCHPAKCHKAADLCNEAEYEWRVEDHRKQKALCVWCGVGMTETRDVQLCNKHKITASQTNGGWRASVGSDPTDGGAWFFGPLWDEKESCEIWISALDGETFFELMETYEQSDSFEREDDNE